MRICYVSNNIQDHDFKFLSKLAEKGYSVIAFSSSRKKIRKEYLLKNIKYVELISNYPNLGKSISQLSKYNFWLYFLWFFFAYSSLNQILKKFKPDIIHGGYVPISGFLCSLINFRPFLLMPWGSDILLFPNKSFIHNLIVKYTITSSNFIVCDAVTVKRKLLSIAPDYSEENIKIFPWGIDLNTFNPNNKDVSDIPFASNPGITIISTRNHESLYSNETLLRSVKKLKKLECDIFLLILGSGSLTENYKKFVKENELNKIVKFVGRVSNSELPLYLNISDIYVSCSKSDGTSVSLLEAMACKLPVIVTDIPANREWVKEGFNGYFFEKGDSDSLAFKIKLLVEKENTRNSFSDNNHAIALEKADWNKNFEKLEKSYRKIYVN